MQTIFEAELAAKKEAQKVLGEENAKN